MNASGKRCKATPMLAPDFCYFHTAETRELHREGGVACTDELRVN